MREISRRCQRRWRGKHPGQGNREKRLWPERTGRVDRGRRGLQRGGQHSGQGEGKKCLWSEWYWMYTLIDNFLGDVMKRLLLLLGAIILLTNYSYSAELIVVPDPNDTDCDDGKCWLQNALDYSYNLLFLEDTTIKIARGTYKIEDSQFIGFRNFDLYNESDNTAIIEGGYDENGQNRILDPDNTIIQGRISDIVDESRGCLYVSNGNGGSVFIEGISFVNSNSSGLNISTDIMDGERTGKITIQNNRFKNIVNVPGIDAQIHVDSNGYPNPGDITLENNIIDSCGGVRISSFRNSEYEEPGPVYIKNNLILNNESNVSAGGLSVYGNSVDIEGNVVKENISLNTTGGIQVYGKNLNINRNIILNNEAGGVGGGLSISSYGDYQFLYLANNIVAMNISEKEGGGVYISGSSMDLPSGLCSIVNNTIYGNKSLSTVDTHHGLSFSNAASDEISIYNNLIWGNTDPVNTGFDIHIGFFGDYIYLFNNNYGTLYEQYPSNKWENINIDPLLASPQENNFHLSANSPCIDSGNSLVEYPDVDYENDPRPYDGNNDGSEIVDIGADEYINWSSIFSSIIGAIDCISQGSCLADMDNDNDTDGSDLAIIIDKLGQSS